MKRTKKIKQKISPNTIYPITPDEQLFVNLLSENKDPVKALTKLNLIPIDASKEQIQTIKEQYLKSPSVQEALQNALRDKIQRLKTTDDAVIAQISRFAFVNPKDLFDSDGNIKAIHDLPYEVACSINQIEVKSLFAGRNGDRRRIGTLTKVKLNSQLDALKVLLEKLILRESPPNVTQYNTNIQNNIQSMEVNAQSNIKINPKELTKEQVQCLLELKGYKQTALGYQPEQEQC
jgi:hypothetical protein